MALFSRRPKAPATAPDATFPYWDQPTADEFRALVRRAFADSGSEVEVYAGHVADSQGRQFGLSNLAAICHNEERGRRAWPELVARHVRTITAGMTKPSPFETLSVDDILASTYCRLMPTEDVLPNMSYADEIAPGLSLVFNLDLPETVLCFTDDNVARFGRETLRAAGTANLHNVRIDERTSVEDRGGRIEVLFGESLFTASVALVLGDVLRRDGVAFEPKSVSSSPCRTGINSTITYRATRLRSRR